MKNIISTVLLMIGISLGFDKSLVGKDFLDFTVIDEFGKEMKASQIISEKPAIIVFFALGDQQGTFKFMPELNELYDIYKNKLTFMTVLLSRCNLEEVRELKRIIPLRLPVYLGYKDAIRNYNILKIDVPIILLIDAKGKIKHLIARPESTEIEIFPPEKRYKIRNTQRERISSSIRLIKGYINDIIKE